ncbi:hypothetical protein WA577_007890, partial [Blastocystis sp. JDR]
MADGKNPFKCYADYEVKSAIRSVNPSLSGEKWSAAFVVFVRKCLVKDVSERRNVSELMNHAFVKESVERMRKEGCSEVLTCLAKEAKKQQAYRRVPWNEMSNTCFLMYKNDGLRWYHEGIAELSSSAVVEFGKEGVIEVDIDSHALLRVDGEEVNGVEHNRVLDLNDDGERWEGDVLDEKPYGWGMLYDSEGEKKYEGFRIGEVNVCYGRSYYPDNGAIEYEGEIFEGKRWGRGIQYDRNGGVLYDGNWLNNEYEYRVAQRVLNNGNQLPTTLEQLRIHNVMGDGKEWKPLDFSCFLNLQLL